MGEIFPQTPPPPLVQNDYATVPPEIEQQPQDTPAVQPDSPLRVSHAGGGSPVMPKAKDPAPGHWSNWK